MTDIETKKREWREFVSEPLEEKIRGLRDEIEEREKNYLSSSEEWQLLVWLEELRDFRFAKDING